MKVLILGSDGYIGWPLLLHLKNRGHDVWGVDNLSRRHKVENMHCISASPIATAYDRQTMVGSNLHYLNLRCDYDSLREVLRDFVPDAIVHLAEQPSAPFSMASRWNCLDTFSNNVQGTLNLLFAIKEECPDTHLIKLGTMGEYGTPDRTIRENDPSFPKHPGSWYHLTKAHDSLNIRFACETWGLRSTDIMQSPVYGIRTDETTDDEKVTRFDFDQYFGTVVNRFCVQAVLGMPLTVYGSGGQIRGFLPLVDSIQCLTLIIENSYSRLGEYTIINQLDEQCSIANLAQLVKNLANNYFKLDTTIDYIPNPRVENEDHVYAVEHHILKALGYKPSTCLKTEIRYMIEDLLRWKSRIEPYKKVIMPTITWR